jgi:hypothetical protein
MKGVAVAVVHVVVYVNLAVSSLSLLAHPAVVRIESVAQAGKWLVQ